MDRTPPSIRPPGPRPLLAAACLAALFGCAEMRPTPEIDEANHLPAPSKPEASGPIPELVDPAPFVPPPRPVEETELYTVVVNDVPVKELLFALARDADLNVDVHGDVAGRVTLNAIDQTLTQILDRLSRQVDLRYELDGETITVSRDTPFFRTYEVGYVNLSRDVDSEVSVSTRVATTGQTGIAGIGGNQSAAGGRGAGGGNESRTELTTRSYNRFWQTLRANVLALLDQPVAEAETNNNVILNAEAGLLTVRATSRQHALIQGYVDDVLVNAKRQVLIEATIVEVTLSDQYQAGVDWSLVLDEGEAGIRTDQSLLGAVTDGFIDNNITSFVFGYADPDTRNGAVDVTIRLLEEFGDTRVLSSPRLMALNNQTAVLKVVQELVYFDIEVTNTDSTLNAQGRTLVESEVRSVPVGLVMAVTPQVSPNDEVTLTIRPTISQQIGNAIDPAPQLIGQVFGNAASDITNTVPVIRVREMESVLKVGNGQVAVLGGLMQDEVNVGTRSVPGISKIPLLGDLLFRTDESVSSKTELVIFLRPVVVRDPSLEGDLRNYRRYLRQQVPGPQGAGVGPISAVGADS